MAMSSPNQALTELKLLGAFYTPPEVAQVLADSVVRDGYHRVLDPSFGGTSFLKAVVDVGRELSLANPAASVFGIDIDPTTINYADHFASTESVPRHNLRLGDFFSFSPEDFGGVLFDAVVGNPPYIRHHWWDPKSKMLAIKCLGAQGIQLSGRSSAWAYFIMHSLNFLRTGGRLAQLLPGSVLQADYAQQVRHELEQRFSRVVLVRLRWKVFDSTPEETVVLFASGFGGGPTTARFENVDTIEALRKLLRGSRTPAYADDWRLSLLTRRQASLWQRVISSPLTHALGDHCQIRIGTVTGANDFFLRTAADAHLRRAGVSLPRAIGDGRWLDCIRWDMPRHLLKEREGRRTRILKISPSASLSRDLRQLVSEGHAAGLTSRHKCRIRQPWYALTDCEVSDAFIRCMGASPGFIVKNEARAVATNAIHRIWWKSMADPDALAVASVSTAFRLGCELMGRTYGGGVLKLDVGVANRLPIPAVRKAGRIIRSTDELLARGRTTEAIDLSDQVVLQGALGFTSKDLASLRDAAQNLCEERRGTLGGRS